MKKVLSLLFVLLVFVIVGGSKGYAQGELQLPSISQLDYQYGGYNYLFLHDSPSEENLLVRDDKLLKVVKASTGTTLLTFPSGYVNKFAANDSSTYFVSTGINYYFDFYLNIFDNYGECIFSDKDITFKDETFSSFYQAAFIPNTNILVLTSDRTTKLLGFDVDKKQVVFYRNITQESVMKVSSHYIALSGGSNEVNIYDINGEYVDTIQADMKIKTMEFSPNGKKLILGGDSNQLAIYDVEQSFEKIQLPSNSFKTDGSSFNFINIDKSEKYLVAIANGSDFRIFDFNTGQRIYTSLDTIHNVGSTSISSDGKYIVVNDTVYDGKNLTKRITNITIPTKYQKIELGTKNSLSLLATLANGTTAEIKTGITWLANNYDVAYLESGKLVAQKVGSLNLKARYLGFETAAKVTVVDTVAPEIKGAKNITVSLYQPFDPKLGVTANDIGDGNVTKNIKITGTVNINKEGKYQLTYTVMDKAKNTAKVIRTVTVKKTLASNFLVYKDKDGTRYYLHRSVFDRKWNPLYNRTFVPYIYDSPKKKNLMFEVDFKEKNTMMLKKIIINAGKEQFTVKVNEAYLFINKNGERYYFQPNSALIKFLKGNVTTKQTVKVKFEGYHGSISYTLNAKQKAAITDTLKYVGY